VFPFAPHLGSEVVDRVAGVRVWEEPWPVADQAMLERDTFELVCQVNGKVRDRVEAPSSADNEELLQLARSSEKMLVHLEGREVVKEVVVPGKLINFVVR
jgi:leucyl-tRNA synthetase